MSGSVARVSQAGLRLTGVSRAGILPVGHSLTALGSWAPRF
ncbi:hypothetical protein QF035_008141 [Streptomyces umbrinus]|uniref:Uncharacterized protein n=1 Tax=Streptomyces umbrinus TaxID=67370 RepID=A0ABU0T423_9ACTN|nr:hypothetical protein [Streptomyces umbrinus]